jgi:hypothetical protein
MISSMESSGSMLLFSSSCYLISKLKVIENKGVATFTSIASS